MTLNLDDNELDVLMAALYDYGIWSKGQLDFQTPLGSSKTTQLVTNKLNNKIVANLNKKDNERLDVD